jgi:NAD-dependent SIR2 family protein deacetylase
MDRSGVMTDITEVQCAKCKVTLQGPADPKPQDVFSCPKCGTGDRFDRVMREVSEYVEEKMAEKFSRSLGDATRGSKNLKVTQKPRPKKVYRFIIDFDLH